MVISFEWVLSELQILSSLEILDSKKNAEKRNKPTSHMESLAFTFREHTKIPQIPYSRFSHLLLSSEQHKFKLCEWPTDHFYEDSLSRGPTKVSWYVVKEGTRQAVTVCWKIQQVTCNVIPSWQKAGFSFISCSSWIWIWGPLTNAA